LQRKTTQPIITQFGGKVAQGPRKKPRASEAGGGGMQGIRHPQLFMWGMLIGGGALYAVCAKAYTVFLCVC